MRKGIIVTLIMLVFSVSVFTVFHVVIKNQAIDLKIAETVLWGDRKAAEGVGVKVYACDSYPYGNQWDLSYTLQENGLKTQTGFFPHAEKRFAMAESRISPIFLKSLSYSSAEFSPEPLAAHPLGSAAKAAATGLDPGESMKKTIRVKDTLDYLPLSITLAEDIPKAGTRIYADHDEKNLPYDYSYFQIPVPEDATASISCKNQDGSSCWEIVGPSLPFLQGASIQSKKGLYVLLDELSPSEESSSSLQLPAKTRGIHYIPFQQGKKYKSCYYLNMEQAHKAYSFAPDSSLILLETNPEGSELYLVTAEAEKIWLTVLRAEADGTLNQIQKTALDNIYEGFFSTLEDPAAGIKIQENELYLFLGNGTFLVLERDSDAGRYQEVLRASLPEKYYDETIYLLKNPGFFPENVSAARKGSRTVLAYSIDAENFMIENDRLGHVLLVFDDEKGLVYMGKYRYSLDSRSLGIERNYGSDIKITP